MSEPTINLLEFMEMAPTEQAQRSRKLVDSVADLLTRNGISPDDLGGVEKVKLYQGYYKDSDGEAHVVDMTGISLSPTWADGPQWPTVQPAAPTTIKYGRRPKVKHEGRITVLLPDPQIGYRRYEDGTLDPMHDEMAMAASLELLSAIQPDRVVNLGDYLDNSAWSSKFTVFPEFVLTTQPSLERGHQFLAQQRAIVGPDATIDLIEGNHDDRLALSVARNTMEALRLRRAGAPEGWPVLSIPILLNLESVGVNYEGGYPAGRLRLADAHGEQTPLYALHGKKLDMIKQAKAESYSTVQGHSHHVSMHTVTNDYDGQSRQVQSWSMGCLCRLDGAVPSTNGGTDATGRPMPSIESWQHAIGVLTETDEGWWLEPVMIHDGVALWGGHIYRGSID